MLHLMGPGVVVVLAMAVAGCLTAAPVVAAPEKAAATKKPNILVILTDDLGYGDVGCYNDKAKVSTPNLDRLATQGMRFTDAHSPATVCTPTRYSVLTGRMAFRTGGRGVFTGVGGPCMIEKDRVTLPGMLRDKGYATACIGKWHVGMSFFDKEGNALNKGGLANVQRADFSRAIPDAPIHRGFDKFFGTVCCPTTDWLYAYVDGDRIPVPPTKILDKTPLPKHEYSVDCRPGMIAPDFEIERIDMVFLEKSKQWLTQHVKNAPGKPFFLYHCMQAVHLPSFPAKEFQGKTKAGPHGDFIHQMDWIVGELMKTLDTLGVADNTVVIFCSDNGPETLSVHYMRKKYGHDGARPWRGVKRDQWEGGHRTPFIVRWPGAVKAGTTSAQPLSLTDIMATCAAIVGTELPNGAAEDSLDMLPVLRGVQGDKHVREYLFQQTSGKRLSIRRGKWKYLDHKGSGGNGYTKGWMAEWALPENAPDAPGQLYDMAADPGETTNLYDEQPEIVKQLNAKIDQFVDTGRSVPERK